METITLPDLENTADVQIVRENVLATGAIYSAYLLEEAHVFQVRLGSSELRNVNTQQATCGLCGVGAIPSF